MSEEESVYNMGSEEESAPEPSQDSIYLEATGQEPPPSLEEGVVEEPRAPGRFQRLARTVLLWAVGLLGIFALGVAATWFTQVTRLQAQNAALQADLSNAQAETQAQLDEQKQAFEHELQASQLLLDEADLHITLLSALVDVSSARVALSQSDVTGARSALAGTDGRLQVLQSDLGPDGVNAVEALRGKLTTAITALADDLDVADNALAQLVDNLLSLERSVFGD